MALIGNINPSWKDMSRFAVHFTKLEPCGRKPYDNFMSILYNREIVAMKSFGIGRDFTHARKSVCFTEVPLQYLRRLACHRVPALGLGFQKEYIVERGGGPIQYAYQNTRHAEAWKAMVSDAIDNPSAPVWDAAPFVDVPGTYGNSNYFWEFEREWRHVGNLQFVESDPAFLIIPEDDHKYARDYFEAAKIDQSGPSYECPFIDPYWDEDRIEAALLS